MKVLTGPLELAGLGAAWVQGPRAAGAKAVLERAFAAFAGAAAP